jgi:alkaline phosphatase D
MSDEAGYIHVSLEDQTPDAVIAYQFVDNQNRKSPVGMCRMALPAGHTGNIQFGVSSCTKLPWAPFPALSELAAYPLDFCVLLGDSSYNDNAVTLQEYRDCWSDALSSQGYLDLLQNAAIVATWDDHEVVNNWDRETIDSARLQAGTQAFFENLAIRPSEQSEFGLWRRLKWGETAEFFILDCRGERFPSRNEYISPAQMNWLKEGLCSSTATWKVVVNSVPIANMPLVFDVEVAIRDRWEGFKAQRDELLTHIEECSVSGVLFLGGDLHMSALTRVEEVGFMRNVFELIVGPGGQRGNVLGALIGGNEQFPYSGSEICTAAVELSASGTAVTRWIGENGQIIAECLFTSEGELLDLQVPIPEE